MVLLEDKEYLKGEKITEEYNKIVILEEPKYVTKFDMMTNQNKRVLEAKVSWKCLDHKGNETVKEILWNPNTHCRTFPVTINSTPTFFGYVSKSNIFPTQSAVSGLMFSDRKVLQCVFGFHKISFIA